MSKELIHHKIKYGVGNDENSNVLTTKIEIPKLTGSMYGGEKSYLYQLVTHAKQNYLDLKNGPPPIHSSTQKAYLTSLFKVVAIKFMESLNTCKYIHYVPSDIALKDTI